MNRKIHIFLILPDCYIQSKKLTNVNMLFKKLQKKNAKFLWPFFFLRVCVVIFSICMYVSIYCLSFSLYSMQIRKGLKDQERRVSKEDRGISHE